MVRWNNEFAYADENDPDYRESSDDEGGSSDDDLPLSLGRMRAQWMVENADAIGELYAAYMTTGRQLFGNAFHQTGNVNQLANFVFKYMQPGAA